MLRDLPGTPVTDVGTIFPMNWRFFPTLDPQVNKFKLFNNKSCILPDISFTTDQLCYWHTNRYVIFGSHLVYCTHLWHTKKTQLVYALRSRTQRGWPASSCRLTCCSRVTWTPACPPGSWPPSHSGYRIQGSSNSYLPLESFMVDVFIKGNLNSKKAISVLRPSTLKACIFPECL